LKAYVTNQDGLIEKCQPLNKICQSHLGLWIRRKKRASSERRRETRWRSGRV